MLLMLENSLTRMARFPTVRQHVTFLSTNLPHKGCYLYDMQSVVEYYSPIRPTFRYR